MATKHAKPVAILFIVLFSFYYQKWLILFFYEVLFGSNDTSDHSFSPAYISSKTNEEVIVTGPLLLDTGNRVNSISGRPLTGKIDDGDTSIGNYISAVDGPNLFFDKEAEAEVLSAIVQYQLGVHQGYSCSFPTLSCGAPVECSLGCQIHYVMTCLMLSYSLNATLVPDFSHWPYAESRWDDVFETVNPAKCQLDEKSLNVVWNDNEILLKHKDTVTNRLKLGLPISRNMGRKLKSTFSNPYLWWAGQFANFTLKYNSKQKRALEEISDKLQLKSSPVVGIVLRRRDKKGEKHKQLHSIDMHLNVAKKYFDTIQTKFNGTRRVFIATDDKNLLKLARKRYRPPKWDIVGFHRQSEAEDILKDIHLLLQCEFIICSFSTDVCRLAVELLDSRDINGARRVKSLNSKYLYLGKEINRLRFIFP